MKPAPEKAIRQQAIRQIRQVPVRVVIFFIELYRTYVSPLRLPTCRFTPTCSQYAVDALAEYGLFRGGWLAAVLTGSFGAGAAGVEGAAAPRPDNVLRRPSCWRARRRDSPRKIYSCCRLLRSTMPRRPPPRAWPDWHCRRSAWRGCRR